MDGDSANNVAPYITIVIEGKGSVTAQGSISNGSNLIPIRITDQWYAHIKPILQKHLHMWVTTKPDNQMEFGDTANDLIEEKTNKIDEQIDGWSLSRSGEIINGRYYTKHALERMAPNTPEVRRELEKRTWEEIDEFKITDPKEIKKRLGNVDPPRHSTHGS